MRKLLGLLGAIGLVASTGVTTVVSCGGDKDDAQLSSLKDAIQAVLNSDANKEGFTDIASAITAIEGYTKNDDNGLVSFEDRANAPTKLNQIVMSDAVAKEGTTDTITVSYQESQEKQATSLNLSDDAQVVYEWGTAKTFDITVKIKAASTIVDLSTVLKNTSINVTDSASDLSETAMEALVISKNAGLNKDEISFSDFVAPVAASGEGDSAVAATPGSIVVKAKEGSTVYNGDAITVNFVWTA